MGRADLNLTSAMFERRSSLQRTMMMMMVVVMMMMTTMASTVEGETCPDPAPSANFTYEAFEGTWYEVGKYQVDNPFEKGCECTRVTYTHATKAFATSCVKNGKVENVTATLIPSPSGPPGVFDEKISFVPITSNAHLAIPLIGTYEGVEFLAEFDCVHHLLGDISYCYHVFVRNADGSHPQGLIEFAQSFAAKAGLIPQSTTWQVTSQANCIN